MLNKQTYCKIINKNKNNHKGTFSYGIFDFEDYCKITGKYPMKKPTFEEYEEYFYYSKIVSVDPMDYEYILSHYDFTEI